MSRSHDVENQPPEFAGRDLWADDAALREAIARERATPFHDHLRAYGRLAGLAPMSGGMQSCSVSLVSIG